MDGDGGGRGGTLLIKSVCGRVCTTFAVTGTVPAWHLVLAFSHGTLSQGVGSIRSSHGNVCDNNGGGETKQTSCVYFPALKIHTGIKQQQLEENPPGVTAEGDRTHPLVFISDYDDDDEDDDDTGIGSRVTELNLKFERQQYFLRTKVLHSKVT